jgi:hypothetical protein
LFFAQHSSPHFIFLSAQVYIDTGGLENYLGAAANLMWQLPLLKLKKTSYFKKSNRYQN